MKICSICKKNKFLSYFSRKESGVRSHCKNCVAEYDRNNLITNPNRMKQIYTAVKKHRNEKTDWINNLKNKPCADCNFSYPAVAMDFDHRNPEEKEIEICNAVRSGWSKKKILKEIEKCDLVCSNCHRIRTHLVRAKINNPSYLKDQRKDSWKNLTEEEVQRRVWETPVSKLAIEWEISGNAIKKWCQRRGISTPPRGYWSKNK